MTTNDWEEYWDKLAGLYNLSAKANLMLKGLVRQALQRTRLETILECEAAVPAEITGPQGPREEYQAQADGHNGCREETLKNLRALKEVIE